MIRRMEAADISAAAEIERAAFSDMWDRGAISGELEKGYAKYFVCERDGRIMGYAGIWCIYETAELVRIAAGEPRQGIGAALMDALIAAARDAGCDRLTLEVRENNIPARAMYEKFGFEPISVRRSYYGGTEDAVIMELRLNG